MFNMFFSLPNRSLDTLIDYNGHRESTYVMVNHSNTLPNTYLGLAGYTHGINSVIELPILSHH